MSHYPAILALACVGAASAQVVPYTGFDSLAGPGDPTPNADFAYQAWLSAVTTATSGPLCIDFDAVALNTAITTTPITLIPGVTLVASPGSPIGAILNTPSESVANGYNTTTPPGLAHRASLVGPFVVSSGLYYDITFSAPIESFGMWVTGEGNTVPLGQMMLTFVDGQAGWMVPMSATMGTQFVGFTDFGESITTVTLLLPSSGGVVQPFISLDDICFTTAPAGCGPDINGDGFLTGDDFDIYVVFFEKGIDAADYNGDSFVTGDDFDLFVKDFEVGC